MGGWWVGFSILLLYIKVSLPRALLSELGFGFVGLGACGVEVWVSGEEASLSGLLATFCSVLWDSEAM